MADKPSRELVLYGDGLARFIDQTFKVVIYLTNCIKVNGSVCNMIDDRCAFHSWSKDVTKVHDFHQPILEIESVGPQRNFNQSLLLAMF
jgi:hypothetical protein